MLKILIVIFSATGNTAKMGEVIQDELTQIGAHVEKKDITSYEERKDPPLSFWQNIRSISLDGQPCKIARMNRILRSPGNLPG